MQDCIILGFIYLHKYIIKHIHNKVVTNTLKGVCKMKEKEITETEERKKEITEMIRSLENQYYNEGLRQGNLELFPKLTEDTTEQEEMQTDDDNFKEVNRLMLSVLFAEFRRGLADRKAVQNPNKSAV